MSDLISRKAAIDAIDTWDKFGVDGQSRIVKWHEGLEPYVHLRDVVTAIVNLPPAQPETPPYVAEIEDEYKKWVKMPHINKPLAKALYEVWKKHDREDVSRNG